MPGLPAPDPRWGSKWGDQLHYMRTGSALAARRMHKHLHAHIHTLMHQGILQSLHVTQPQLCSTVADAEVAQRPRQWPASVLQRKAQLDAGETVVAEEVGVPTLLRAGMLADVKPSWMGGLPG